MIAHTAEKKDKYSPRNMHLYWSQYVATLTIDQKGECLNQLLTRKSSFHKCCNIVRDRGLHDTHHVCGKEQLALFLHTLGHNIKNRTNDKRFYRSGETISRQFYQCLNAINCLYPEFIKQVDQHSWKCSSGFEVYNFYDWILLHFFCTIFKGFFYIIMISLFILIGIYK